MYCNACLLYEDIESELRQEKTGLYLTLRSLQLDMSLCTALVDGCSAMSAKANLAQLAESDAKDLTGALALEFTLPEKATTAPRQGLGLLTKTA